MKIREKKNVNDHALTNDALDSVLLGYIAIPIIKPIIPKNKANRTPIPVFDSE